MPIADEYRHYNDFGDDGGGIQFLHPPYGHRYTFAEHPIVGLVGASQFVVDVRAGREHL